MLACIIIVGIALAWLMRETDWLRVNLMDTRKPLLMLPAPALKPALITPDVVITPYNPVCLLDTYHYKPASFESLEMPELKGEVNIFCKME